MIFNKLLSRYKSLSYTRTITQIGKNNKIADSAIIHDNVTIGTNNVIHDGVIIYPNVKIGDNNIIFPRNIIGEFPISSGDDHKDYWKLKEYKGVEIGDFNFFHVNNLIFSGIDGPTQIGNHNKFLAENSLGHDCGVETNVTFYHRIVTGGFCNFLDHSNIGMGAIIHQRTVIGQYSMIGANNTVTKHVFPYYINIHNKIHRLNSMKIPKDISLYDETLREINENISKKNYDIEQYHLPERIKHDITIFLSKI